MDSPPEHSLTGLPKFDNPVNDLLRSTRGQTLHAVLKDPEAATWGGETPRRMAVERAVLSVREKSSCALRDCFVSGEAPLRVNDVGRPTTRTAMMAMRKEELTAQNTAIGSNPRSILPVGVQPGAPGKTPGYQRFTHHDVDRLTKGR